MDVTTIFLGEAVIIANLLIAYFLFGKKLEKNIDNIHKRIDMIFSVDKPSPNDAAKSGGPLQELNEQNVYIPPNVKFEVEGQDNVPLEYQNK